MTCRRSSALLALLCAALVPTASCMRVLAPLRGAPPPRPHVRAAANVHMLAKGKGRKGKRRKPQGGGRGPGRPAAGGAGGGAASGGAAPIDSAPAASGAVPDMPTPLMVPPPMVQPPVAPMGADGPPAAPTDSAPAAPTAAAMDDLPPTFDRSLVIDDEPQFDLPTGPPAASFDAAPAMPFPAQTSPAQSPAEAAELREAMSYDDSLEIEDEPIFDLPDGPPAAQFEPPPAAPFRAQTPAQSSVPFPAQTAQSFGPSFDEAAEVASAMSPDYAKAMPPDFAGDADDLPPAFDRSIEIEDEPKFALPTFDGRPPPLKGPAAPAAARAPAAAPATGAYESKLPSINPGADPWGGRLDKEKPWLEKFIFNAAWTGIGILVFIEVFINSPLFELAKPLLRAVGLMGEGM